MRSEFTRTRLVAKPGGLHFIAALCDIQAGKMRCIITIYCTPLSHLWNI